MEENNDRKADNYEISGFFSRTDITDNIAVLSDEDYLLLAKCPICGRKIHSRKALVIDEIDGLTAEGKRCQCCGTVYLKNRIVQALIMACSPQNVTINYNKEISYDYIPLKKSEQFTENGEILFIEGMYSKH